VLNPNKKEIKETPKNIEAEREEYERIVVESSFTGKGGEHLVCSELLFLGFNASIMSVDVGVDISAIKNGQFFGIQVKTSQKNSNDIYNFHIRKKSFERFNQGNIFYILVLRDNKKAKFIILPSSEIERRIKEGAIFAVNNKTGYALSVKVRDEKIYLGNKNHDMKYFLDNWGLI
jgi:Holliday junction resolvase